MQKINNRQCTTLKFVELFLTSKYRLFYWSVGVKNSTRKGQKSIVSGGIKLGLKYQDLQYLPFGTYYCSLVKRREKWAEQKKEEEKRKPDPDCPKGHKRVPEEERRKVLEKLKKCKKN